MFEQTFYNLLNSILEMDDNKSQEFLDNYNEFLESLLYNQELMNETKRQMQLEGLTIGQIIEKKEDLLADMRALIKPLNLSDQKKKMYDKVLEVVNKIYDNIMEQGMRFCLTVPFELCREGAKEPTYAHSDDAGFDFYLPEDFTIKAHEYGKIAPTGIKMSIPTGYELQIRPRSGNSVKTTLRIANAPGTVDPGYSQEIGIICDNIGDTDLEFKAGERIAQGIFATSPKGIFTKVGSIEKVVGANRGGGFGSSGK